MYLLQRGYRLFPHSQTHGGAAGRGGCLLRSLRGKSKHWHSSLVVQ